MSQEHTRKQNKNVLKDRAQYLDLLYIILKDYITYNPEKHPQQRLLDAMEACPKWETQLHQLYSNNYGSGRDSKSADQEIQKMIKSLKLSITRPFTLGPVQRQKLYQQLDEHIRGENNNRQTDIVKQNVNDLCMHIAKQNEDQAKQFIQLFDKKTMDNIASSFIASRKKEKKRKGLDNTYNETNTDTVIVNYLGEIYQRNRVDYTFGNRLGFIKSDSYQIGNLYIGYRERVAYIIDLLNNNIQNINQRDYAHTDFPQNNQIENTEALVGQNNDELLLDSQNNHINDKLNNLARRIQRAEEHSQNIINLNEQPNNEEMLESQTDELYDDDIYNLLEEFYQ